MKFKPAYNIATYIILLIIFSIISIKIGALIREHSLQIIFIIPIIYGYVLFKYLHPSLGKKLKYGNECVLYAAATLAACALVVNTSIFTIQFFEITMKNIFGYVITTILATSSVIKLLITIDDYKNS